MWAWQPIPAAAQQLANTAITGTASITLGALTVASTGTLAIKGTSAVTLGALTVASTGTLPIVGSAAVTLGALTVSSASRLAIAGAASITLGPLTAAATGTVAITGTASITLGALTVSATGTNSATAPLPLRDYIISLIVALTPTSLSGTKFRAYRNEGGADFPAWAAANLAGALRRFQVRDTGMLAAPETDDAGNQSRVITFEILVAYPQTARYGRGQALSRDDVISEDQHQIETAIGVRGWRSFLTAPIATWLPGSVTRERMQGVDFLRITQPMRYPRTIS